jgi:cytochrome c peroxidase
MKKRHLVIASLVLTVAWSCSDDIDPKTDSSVATQAILTDATVVTPTPNLPATPYNYSNIALPNHLKVNAFNGGNQVAATATDNTPATNAITDQGATLGRVLFYDKNLSLNRTVSCASCHKQANGFSDTEVLSKGFADGLTRRHSMGLTDARFYQRGRFFWDERAATLEDQVLQPLQNTTEMGLTLAQIQSRVQEQAYYAKLFTNAFGNNEITNAKIARALAQFIRSMVSITSKYDVARAAVQRPEQNFPGFTASENNGKRLFMSPPTAGGGACIACHGTEAFVSSAPNSNGLDAVSTTDKGIFEAITNQRFLGTFKSPSLRNIGVRAPYMHDGRFANLAAVVEHYNSGIKNHINLGNPLKDASGNPIRLNWTAAQKADMVAFLNTLTDAPMLTDPKYSNPFLITVK